MSLKSAATSVASGLASGAGAGLGLDPMTILTIVSTVLPLFLQWFQSCPQSATQTPQQVLANSYDEATGTFDQHLIDQARPHTRRAARQNGQRHLTRDQLDAITVQSFLQGKDADEATMAACLSETPPFFKLQAK